MNPLLCFSRHSICQHSCNSVHLGNINGNHLVLKMRTLLDSLEPNRLKRIPVTIVGTARWRNSEEQ